MTIGTPPAGGGGLKLFYGGFHDGATTTGAPVALTSDATDPGSAGLTGTESQFLIFAYGQTDPSSEFFITIECGFPVFSLGYFFGSDVDAGRDNFCAASLQAHPSDTVIQLWGLGREVSGTGTLALAGDNVKYTALILAQLL